MKRKYFIECEKKLNKLSLPSTYKEALLELVKAEEEKEKLNLEVAKLQEETKAKTQLLLEQEPKVTYYDRILQDTKTTLTISQIAKDYDLSGIRLNELLHEKKIQYKQNKVWLLYSEHVGKGYTKSKSFEKPNGEFGFHTYWTQKGRVMIHNILESCGIMAVEDRE